MRAPVSGFVFVSHGSSGSHFLVFGIGSELDTRFSVLSGQ